jgi:hypothetical protein
MAVKTRYHSRMRQLALFSLAFAFLIAGSGATGAFAQSVNWGPSVTSMGFGGSNHLGGVPPSVTSLGFGRMGASGENGSPHFRGPNFQSPNFRTPMFSQNQAVDRLHHHHEPFYPVWGGYAYPVIDYGDVYQTSPDSPDNAENPDEYKGGPTIFDRRGDGQYSARRSEQAPQAAEVKPISISEPAAEVAPQPQTVLVFKDGHQANVDNYAIVGSTLYDFTGGVRHKIALADLNLTATTQQNDDRGVDFELPAGSAAN